MLYVHTSGKIFLPQKICSLPTSSWADYSWGHHPCVCMLHLISLKNWALVYKSPGILWFFFVGIHSRVHCSIVLRAQVHSEHQYENNKFVYLVIFPHLATFKNIFDNIKCCLCIALQYEKCECRVGDECLENELFMKMVLQGIVQRKPRWVKSCINS
jgi:hypothetical protein